MNSHAIKTQKNKSQVAVTENSLKSKAGDSAFHFIDNRPEIIAQRKLLEIANDRPSTMQAIQMKTVTNNSLLTYNQKKGDEGEKLQQGEVKALQEKNKGTSLHNKLNSGNENSSFSPNNLVQRFKTPGSHSDEGESDSETEELEKKKTSDDEVGLDDSYDYVIGHSEEEGNIINSGNGNAIHPTPEEPDMQEVNPPEQRPWSRNEHADGPNPQVVRPTIGKRGKAVSQNRWYNATMVAGKSTVANAKRTEIAKGHEKRQKTSKIKELAAIGIGKILSPNQVKRNMKNVDKRSNKKIADAAESQLEEIGIVLPTEKIRESISDTPAPTPVLTERKQGYLKKKSNEKKDREMKAEMATKAKEREAENLQILLDIEEKKKNSKKKDTSDKGKEEEDE